MKFSTRDFWHHMHTVVNGSGGFIAITMALVGVILVTQAAVQARIVIGDLSLVGPAFLQITIREFGPTITAMLIAARYGAGIAAEVGSMAVTEQLDALRACAADPWWYCAAPRIAAGIFGMLPIVILGTSVAYFLGGVTLHYGFDVSWAAYLSTDLTRLSDLCLGISKSIAFGVAIPTVSVWAGFGARGGAAGVGLATTQAVIGSSLAVLALDVVLGFVAWAL